MKTINKIAKALSALYRAYLSAAAYAAICWAVIYGISFAAVKIAERFDLKRKIRLEKVRRWGL